MRISKYSKRAISVLLLMFFCVSALTAIGYWLEPVSYATYFNHDMEELEQSKEQVDLAFVGASRVYRSYVPSVFEEEMGIACAINAGSSSQPISGSYYQLKDLIRRVKPKRVVLGVTWDGLFEDSSLQKNLIVYDRLKGLNSLLYGAADFKGMDMLYLLRAYRFRSNIGKLLEESDVWKYVDEKQAVEANDYKPKTEKKEYYADKGFVYSKKSFKQGNVAIKKGTFERSEIDETAVGYLDKIVDLCAKHDIQLFLVSGPTTMMRLYNVENYQDAVDFYEEYAKEKGLVYHNLNYLKNREELFPDTLMHDYNHLNGEGAQIVSKIYAEILQKDIQGMDTSSYFYKDLESLKEDVKRVVAVGAKIEASGTSAHVKVKSSQNKGSKPYYQIEISTDKGKTYDVLKEWTQEKEFDVEVPGESGYRLKVRARLAVPPINAGSSSEDLAGQEAESQETEAFQVYKM